MCNCRIITSVSTKQLHLTICLPTSLMLATSYFLYICKVNNIKMDIIEIFKFDDYNERLFYPLNTGIF